MKVVINKCYGGFGLSAAAMEKLGLPLTFVGRPDITPEHEQFLRDSNYVHNADLGIESDNYYAFRTDPRLVAVVEELGESADGQHAELAVVEIPDGVQWEIEEYDGIEWIAEVHRTWG